MTREQAKKNMIAFGIEEPSEEQISNYLNQIGAETKKEKDRADGYKANADKAAELQAELDRINEQNLSDIEKANKATETANNRVAELEKQVKFMQTRAKLAEKGIVGEQADKLFLEDGSIDFDTLGQIISDREAAAATAKEKEIANNSTNPGGGSACGGSSADSKPDDVKNAESITFGTMVADQSAKDYYLMK